VLDERGYAPASKVGAELLFDVISSAYERSSVIVTTNLPFEEWKEVLGSERLREARRWRRGAVGDPAEPTVDAGAGGE